MNEDKYEYKASELNEDYGNKQIKSFCNEYGINLGSSRRKQNDIFDNALRLKRFKSDEN